MRWANANTQSKRDASQITLISPVSGSKSGICHQLRSGDLILRPFSRFRCQSGGASSESWTVQYPNKLAAPHHADVAVQSASWNFELWKNGPLGETAVNLRTGLNPAII